MIDTGDGVNFRKIFILRFEYTAAQKSRHRPPTRGAARRGPDRDHNRHCSTTAVARQIFRFVIFFVISIAIRAGKGLAPPPVSRRTNYILIILSRFSDGAAAVQEIA